MLTVDSALRHGAHSGRLADPGSAVERCGEGVSAGMSP
jgi:hypothetical protein